MYPPIQRYNRYREHCESVIIVRPMSFELWQQLEPWLEERGRIAILDELRYHHKGNTPAVMTSFLDRFNADFTERGMREQRELGA